MSESNNHQAMIIPKGAKIVTRGEGDISIDVQGDLILQENQKGLTSLTSHHGSILIDEGVQVNASKIDSKHMIRVRGSLTIENLSAEAVQVDGGTLKCDSLESGKLEAEEASLSIKAVKAGTVAIKGGLLEVGTIKADVLSFKNGVRGSVLIAHADKREVDSTVQLKGGFESDVELFGYLMKYREEVLSERVVQKLKESNAAELSKLLLEAHDEEAAGETVVEVEGTTVNDSPEEPVFESGEDDESPFSTPDSSVAGGEPASGNPDFPMAEMHALGEKLNASLKKSGTSSAVMKLIATGLNQGDADTLKTIFSRWKSNVEDEKASADEEVRELLAEIETRVNSL